MKTANVVRGFAPVLIVLGALALQGCAMYPKYSETVYFADYRPYTAEGFTISPSSSGFTYESIGDLEIMFVPGKLKTQPTDTPMAPAPAQTTDSVASEDSIFDDFATWCATPPTTSTASKTILYEPDYGTIVERMVRQAQALGADALLNFRITQRKEYVKSGGRVFDVWVYVASGFAVKLTK